MSPGRRRAVKALVVTGCVVATLGTLAVIAAGFALSFDAIRAVGTAAGMNPRLAWLLPVSVDGAMLVATITAILLKSASRSPWYPWVVVAVGVAVSVACNAEHAGPAGGVITLTSDVARAVSAIPAVTLFLSVHLLITMALAVISHPAPEVTPEPVAEDTSRDMPTTPAQAEDTAEQDAGTPDETAGGAGRSVRLGAAEARVMALALHAYNPDMPETQIAELIGRSERHTKRILASVGNGKAASG